MLKQVAGGAKTFIKRLGHRVRYVARRQESLVEAISSIARDARKLSHIARRASQSKDQLVASRYCDKSRKAFNARDYRAAEEFANKAIEMDRECDLAYAYLGFALYKSGQVTEAYAMWKRAVALDPNGEGGRRAQQKIDAIERRKAETIGQLEDDIRRL